MLQDRAFDVAASRIVTRRVRSALAGVALAIALIAHEQYRKNRQRWAAVQHRDDLIAQTRAKSAGDAQQPPTLTQIVAALSVTYTDPGVLVWLTACNQSLKTDPGLGYPGGRPCSPREFIEAGRILDVAHAVRAIGDADPSEFTSGTQR